MDTNPRKKGVLHYLWPWIGVLLLVAGTAQWQGVFADHGHETMGMASQGTSPYADIAAAVNRLHAGNGQRLTWRQQIELANAQQAQPGYVDPNRVSVDLREAGNG